MEITDSLVGMVRHNGILCKMVKHTDGTTDYIPVDAEESITERFKDTETTPNDWTPPEEDTKTHPMQDWNPETVSTLQLSVPHTRDEHFKISVKFESLMIRIFDGTEVDTQGNRQFKGVLEALCLIMGGDYKEHIKKIK
jgi:hypothetical protein